MNAFALGLDGEAQAYFGRMSKARETFKRAIGAYEALGKKESAANVLVLQARIEAETGDEASAKRDATAALALDSSLGVKERAAYAYAKEVMSLNSLAADAQEGIAAFLEKRAACWVGR